MPLVVVGLAEIQITGKLRNIFLSVLSRESIELLPETSASDVEEWDSLNQIKIILACEKKFKVKLKARDINNLENVGAFINLLIKINAKI